MSSPIDYRAECGLGAGLLVERFRLVEELDEPYLCEVDLRLDELDPDPDAALGGDAAIDVTRDGFSRRVTGIVRATTTLRETAHTEESGAIRLEIAPALWMLSLRRDTRMFQEKSVPEILEAVLGEGLAPYGREVSLELDESYPRREYCLQYQETDLDFAQRLMREEGISYSFDHAGAVELLVLRDANASYSPAEGGASVQLSSDRRGMLDDQPVLRFERVHRSTITKVTLRDHDFTRPPFTLEGTEGDADDHGRTRESYEHGWGRSVTLWDYDAGGRSYQQRDEARQARVRLEAHRALGLTGRGIGRVMGFTPGTTFTLNGHPTPGVDGEYLLVRVEHHDAPAEGSDEAYHNRFECIPLDVPYRPRRVMIPPRIPSIQTAVVTGPPGEEIHTDEHGRVKVQFHWDRENPKDDTSSCWIRVQQKWAGEGWGFWWLPRVGMEVVVQFVDGDPDRPLVTGAVYDGANGTPYPLPADKTKSTIKSNSTPGGGGSNEFRFEDLAGSEEIYTHAQKDYNEVVENDHTTLVHNDQTIEVDNDQTQTVHANQTERVDVNQDVSVGGNRSVHVEGSFDETVDGTETRHVVGAVSEMFDANETRDVGANLTETLQATETRVIGASQSETIGGNRTVDVAAASSWTIGGSLTQTVGGGVSLTTPGTYDVTATGGYTGIVAGGLSIVSAGGMFYGAPAGVQQVDSFRDIVAGTIAVDGAWVRSITLISAQAYGAIFTMVGASQSIELAKGFVGMTFHVRASAVRAIGAKIKGHAVRLRQGPEVG